MIELLTEVPPYYELNPMSAMFKIVSDPCPPLPDDISDVRHQKLNKFELSI